MQVQDTRDLTTVPVALYGRNSGEEQAENQTILNQVGFLQNYVKLYGLTVADEYWDEGVSGTIALPDRPAGARLLEDARAGRFGAIIVYRVDRLGRNIRHLLNAHDELKALGVDIISATEPIDTRMPIGAFIFTLLGSLAELERETILERTLAGRQRVAGNGKRLGGSMTLGYVLDAAGQCALSRHPVDALNTDEAGLVRLLMQHADEGASTVELARWMTEAGVPNVNRWPTGKEHDHGPWTHMRVYRILTNPTYTGRMTQVVGGQAITVDVPAIVDEATFQRIGTRLASAKKKAKSGSNRVYLLGAGLMRCGCCTWGYVGQSIARPDGTDYVSYRCGGVLYRDAGTGTPRCTASKQVAAAPLEALIWNRIRRYAEEPGEMLAEAKGQLRTQLASASTAEATRQAKLAEAAELDQRRATILTLVRRGKATLEEAERDLDAIALELAAVQAEARACADRAALAASWEASQAEALVVAANLPAALAKAEHDPALRAAIVRGLVREIVIETTGEGKAKRATAHIRWALNPVERIESRRSRTPVETEDHYAMVDRAYELEARDGYLVVPDDRAGLGIELDETRMKDYLIEEIGTEE